METRAPTMTRIAIAFGFTVSCFGIALFLWLTFGGPVPLTPEGYRFTASFDEATQLVSEADVRISGVSVGSVSRIDLDSAGRSEATIEIEARYAPIPADTRAVLRQKTLLGETYVELTPGSGERGMLDEGGSLAATQVSDTVQLDEIFRAFDERTRVAFRAWMQGQAGALAGRGEDLSIAIASLDPFARELGDTLRVLDTQRLAIRELIGGGGEVFGALSERSGQLRGLIENADTVFETTARRNVDLAAAFLALPTFLRESRATLVRLEEFAADTDPVVSQLRPAARELGPTLDALGSLGGELERFFPPLREAARRAPSGFDALRRLIGIDLPPLLGELEAFLPRLNPILEGVRRYRRELAAFLANVAAATNGIGAVDPVSGEFIRHLRTEAPLAPEAFAAYPNRLRVNRTNPYVEPGGYRKLRTGLESFETRHCTSGIRALLDPLTPTEAPFIDRLRLPEDEPGDAEARAGALFDRIELFAFDGGLDSNDVPAPACTQQAPFESIGAPAELSDYLHVRSLP